MKKKLKLSIWLIIVSVSFLALAVSCKKEEDNDPETITDKDGNVYHMITIGSQVWLKENLKTTHLNDGAAISLVSGDIDWADLATPGYCFYDNAESTYKASYGALYNWFAVSTGKLCPSGWHVPSAEEWNTLATSLGGKEVAGGKMKESGTSHWEAPNTDATNESKFTGLPGGQRSFDGNFSAIGINGSWWSSTLNSVDNVKFRALSNSSAGLLGGNHYFETGISIRCVKD